MPLMLLEFPNPSHFGVIYFFHQEILSIYFLNDYVILLHLLYQYVYIRKKIQ